MLSHRIAATSNQRHRLWWLRLSLVSNLGILATFKYFNFFVDSAAALLEQIGLPSDPVVLRVALPVGISFYTFQTLSYTIDVYRRQIDPAQDLLTFAVYVAYFPQLVAGPIERATRLLPQLERERSRPTGPDVASALSLITLGLFKKVVVGDLLAVLVDDGFGRASTLDAGTLLLTVYAFAFQLYADFSGYSDIARGVSRLFGIELIRNFEQPYLSRSITEIWRRWHISLSDWLRDYLYIPLGGNRSGIQRTYINLSITMLLGGLWHGASWTFIAWGGLHGLFLSIERATGKGGDPDRPLSWKQLPNILATFHLWCLALVFFRSTSFSQVFDVFEGIGTARSGSLELNLVALSLMLIPAMVILDLWQRRLGHHDVAAGLRPVTQGVLAGAAVVLIILGSGGGPVPFIYFQF